MKANYLKNQLKQFLTVSTLFLGVLAVSHVSFAGDRAGNGGSGGESEMAAQQAQVESISLKIKHFFQQNKKKLASEFPEVLIPKLVQIIEEADLRVVETKQLIDKHGKSRTCLNFPESSLIECKSAGIAALSAQPAAMFVLIFHEYLGLLGVEETSPTNPSMIDGYSISKRIAPYVTKVNDYDLVMTSSKNSFEKFYFPMIHDEHIDFSSNEDGVCIALGYSKAVPGSKAKPENSFDITRTPIYWNGKNSGNLVIDQNGQIQKIIAKDSFPIAAITCR